MTCVGLEVTEKGKCKCDSYPMAMPRDVCVCREMQAYIFHGPFFVYVNFALRFMSKCDVLGSHTHAS